MKHWTLPSSRVKFINPPDKVIKSHFSKAFTLIELIVVIVLIAILVAILLPVLSTVLENARTTKCASNLRQIGASMFSFANEHNGYFPESGANIPWGNTDPPPPAGTGQASWTEQLSVYLGLSVNSNGTTSNDPQYLAGKSIFTCPSSSLVKTADKYYSYFNGAHAAFAATNSFGPVKEQLISFPSKQILAGDITDWPDAAGLLDADKDDYSQNPFDLQSTFHRGKVNILFADGHVGQLLWNSNLKPPGYFDVKAMSTHYTGTSLDDPNVSGYLSP